MTLALIIHAVLMVIAWWWLLTPAILISRYFRWYRFQLFGSQLWFQAHRAIGITAALLIWIGMLAILINEEWRLHILCCLIITQKLFTIGGTHKLYGLLAAILAGLQPIIALLRCDPNHPKRFIFAWIHRAFGIAAWILAAAAMVFATEMRSPGLNADGYFGSLVQDIMTFYLSFVVLTFLAMQIMTFVQKRQSRDKELIETDERAYASKYDYEYVMLGHEDSNGSRNRGQHAQRITQRLPLEGPLEELPGGRNLQADEMHNQTTEKLKTFLLTVFVMVSSSVVIALCIMITISIHHKSAGPDHHHVHEELTEVPMTQHSMDGMHHSHEHESV